MKTEKNREWKDGWTTVAAAGCGVGTVSIHFYALGGLIAPLQAEFGWSRAQITGGLLFTSVGLLVGSPLFGMLSDRWNVRRMALFGLALYCGALGLLATTGPAIWTWYAVWGLLALVQGVAGFVVWTMPIAGRFDRHRGLALALTMAGTAVASAVTPMVVQTVTAQYGWRTAILVLAGCSFVLSFGIGLAWFHDRRPPRNSGASAKLAIPVPGFTVREAIAMPAFWQIAAAFTLASCAASSIVVHFQPILTSSGLSASRAAACTALIGPGLFAGRLLSGILLDRLPARIVATLFLTGPILAGMLLIWDAGGPWQAFASAFLIGVMAGSEVDLIAYMASRYFGLRNYGTIYGLLGGGFALGAGSGPSIAGMVYDHTGSYSPVIVGAIATFCVCAGLVMSLGRYPRLTGEIQSS